MDRLSNLPDNAIDMILNCLPLYDAVRTSVLSKQWKYRWAILSKLSLGYAFFDAMYRLRRKPPTYTYVNLVKTILTQYIGPFLKLELYIPDLDLLSIAEINSIICFVLRNGVRELTVIKATTLMHSLPSLLFSCPEQLTTLELENCVFDPPIEFSGFPNLKSFSLNSTRCCNLGRLSCFISNCPQLRKIQLDNLTYLDQNLCIHGPRVEELSIYGSIRSISLEEVQNLLSLHIHLVNINEDMEKATTCSNYMLHLFNSLCKIKYLYLGGYICQLLGGENGPRKLSAELHYLKNIEVFEVDLGHKREFHFLLCLIRSSPNLLQLEIQVLNETSTGEGADNLSYAGNHFDFWLQHLRTVRISNLMGTRAELIIIKILLGCSPVLEVMYVEAAAGIDNHAMVMLSKEFMQFRHASSIAQLICKDCS